MKIAAAMLAVLLPCLAVPDTAGAHATSIAVQGVSHGVRKSPFIWPGQRVAFISYANVSSIPG